MFMSWVGNSEVYRYMIFKQLFCPPITDSVIYVFININEFGAQEYVLLAAFLIHKNSVELYHITGYG